MSVQCNTTLGHKCPSVPEEVRPTAESLCLEIQRILELFLFEKNDKATRFSAEAMVKAWLQFKHNTGAIGDYAVQCDLFNNHGLEEHEVRIDIAVKFRAGVVVTEFYLFPFKIGSYSNDEPEKFESFLRKIGPVIQDCRTDKKQPIEFQRWHHFVLLQLDDNSVFSERPVIEYSLPRQSGVTWFAAALAAYETLEKRQSVLVVAMNRDNKKEIEKRGRTIVKNLKQNDPPHKPAISIIVSTCSEFERWVEELAPEESDIYYDVIVFDNIIWHKTKNHQERLVKKASDLSGKTLVLNTVEGAA